MKPPARFSDNEYSRSPRCWTVPGLLILLVAASAGPGLAQSHTEPREPIDSARAAYSRGQYADVLSHSESLLKSDDNRAPALHLRSLARIELGRRHEQPDTVRAGIADARQAIRITQAAEPAYYLAYLRGMTVLTELESAPIHATIARDTAQRILATRLSPEMSAELWYHRGCSQAVLQDFEPAVADLRQTLQINDRHLGAWLALADTLARSGETAAARKTYDEVCDRFPESAIALNNRGLLLSKLGERQLAVADFTKAIDTSTAPATAYVNRGWTLLELNEPASAAADLTAAIQLDPNLSIAFRKRAVAWLLQNDPVQAVADLEEALQLRPTPATQIDLALALFTNRDFTRSAEMLAEVHLADPALGHTRIWHYAALRCGDQQPLANRVFAADLARIRTSPATSSWNDWLIGSMAGLVQPEDLLQAAENHSEQNSGRLTEAHFFLGLRYQLEDNAAAAREHFQQAVQTQRADLAAWRAARIALQP